ncbi:MAG: hypothetical protein LC753_09980 [Acidobacteria bacterium]|nr:hypothetical protein [Acidobacteriota bacterium]
MSGCGILASGEVELYFYDELDDAARVSVERHVGACEECRRALEELSVIRAALSARPEVTAPPGADWSGFMARLDAAVRRDRPSTTSGESGPVTPARIAVAPPRAYVAYLAVAALLALVTMSVVFVLRARAPEQPVVTTSASPPAPSPAPALGLASLSEQHFERSKLVVLGLASKDARSASAADWGYERELASTLLSDTRLYRMAAEDSGLRPLADVMGDLEILLLQTSMSTGNADGENLEQLQRLISKRDLLAKMDVVANAGL